LFRLLNSTSLERYSGENEDLKSVEMSNHSYQMICGLKKSISLPWRSFLIDVRFGLNYTTFRSIFSEIIPSLLVSFFNIGIILRVIQSKFLLNSSSTNIRQSQHGSFQSKEGVDGLIVHNRPRTSWMNIVLIIHSCLFFFSSLTATIVHWSTSDALLSYWISVVILANCSLNFYVYCASGKSFRNEIRKLLFNYFQFYCFLKFMNLFRTKSEREQVTQTVRMRFVRYRSTILPPQTTNHIRTASVTQRYN
jgi:hypothetical protein